MKTVNYIKCAILGTFAVSFFADCGKFRRIGNDHHPIILNHKSSIYSFENDTLSLLDSIHGKLYLTKLHSTGEIKSQGSVRPCLVENIWYKQGSDGEKIEKIDRRLSVCYDGVYYEYYANGHVFKKGCYDKNMGFKGVWITYDEQGKEVDQNRY